MINFRCRCTHEFSVPDDQAGESLQCPSCGLLVDVPTIDDLPNLQDDGFSYVLKDAEPGPAASKLPDVRDTPSIVARHDQKDRRMPLSEFLKIGTTDDDLLQIKDEVRPGVPKHPKYDPVTGELIVPIDVKREPLVARPVATAQPVVLGYQKAKVDPKAPTIWTPFIAMFELPNLMVLAIITAIQLMTMIFLVMGATMWILLLLVLPMFLMPIAHFASIVDETGPTRNDEIPRPLRGGNLYEDYMLPLVQVTVSFAMACLPVWLVNRYGVRLPWIANVGLLVCFFGLVPAMLITTITSGAVNNWLPQRSLSVIAAAKADYLVATVVGFFATILFFVASIFSANIGNTLTVILLNPLGPKGLKGTITGLPYWAEISLTVPFLLFACYLMHVFCWQLGIIYRKHHERFAWVLQKHDSSVRTDTIAQLHQHRQREIEKRAEQARQNMQRRAAAAPGPSRPR